MLKLIGFVFSEFLMKLYSVVFLQFALLPLPDYDGRITEYPELKGTHKDHPALQAASSSHCCLVSPPLPS